MTCLFWNIHKNDANFRAIINIVAELSVDIIALAEFPKDTENDDYSSTLLGQLHSVTSTFTQCRVISNKAKVVVFYRADKVDYTPGTDIGKLSIKKFRNVGAADFFSFAFCHFESKFDNTDENQSDAILDEVSNIEDYEKNVSGDRNTIVCGDFNMLPYNHGVMGVRHLNAVMSMNIARNNYHRVHGKDYPYFYNPMWSLMGDYGNGEIPGTYYHSPIGRYDPAHWSILDQVIYRPEVDSHFDKASLKIVGKGTTFNLLTDEGFINEQDYSDHLPILFTINN